MPRTIAITGTSGGFGKLCVERSAAAGLERRRDRPQEHRPGNRDGTPDRILAAITLDIDDITTA